MSGPRARHVVPLLLILATTVACAGETDPDSATDPEPATSSSPLLEAITAQGIASVVREVVGADLIESYAAVAESDTVGVLVKLTGRQVLVVNVQVSGEAPISSCEDMAETVMETGDCFVDEDGTIVASAEAEPFSDDNTSGSTVLAQAVNPETGRVVYSLYETYSRTAALDAATLIAIVTDPALAAMTDPATNDAGNDIEVAAAGT
jgi:hypothetical protein